MGCLYCIKSPSGKKYIGITLKSAAERFSKHCTASRKSQKLPIYRAIKKYGRDAMAISVLCVSDNIEYLRLVEIRAIAALNTLLPNGYNATSGGEGTPGRILSDAARRRISAAQVGRPVSAETRIKISASMRSALAKKREMCGGIIFRPSPSIEARIKNRNSQLGKKHTEETKQKIRQSRLDHYASMRAKELTV